MAELDKDEQEVFDLLTEAWKRIRGWGLDVNLDELDHSFHMVQLFVIQHMLQRENPKDWAIWYKDKK